MFYLVQLVSTGEAGRSAADDGDLLAGARLGRLRGHHAVLERPVDDGALDVLDRDRELVDAEDARALARGRAHSSREFCLTNYPTLIHKMLLP